MPTDDHITLTDEAAMNAGAILNSVAASLSHAEKNEAPYRHWILRGVFPQEVLAQLNALDFPLQELDGVSGKREYHNDSRHYFDRDAIDTHPAAKAVAEAFQSAKMVRMLEDFFGADLEGTFLRLEYAQDVTGFWLQPHTDLGVKRITILIYLSDGEGHGDLGTDIYDGDAEWAARSPFGPGVAMAFVPGEKTYHGFERRTISGVRKSLILNYVTTDWRERSQLAFPEETVSAGRAGA